MGGLFTNRPNLKIEGCYMQWLIQYDCFPRASGKDKTESLPVEMELILIPCP